MTLDQQLMDVPGIGPISYHDLWKAASLRAEAHALGVAEKAKETAFFVLYLIGAGAGPTCKDLVWYTACYGVCRDALKHVNRLVRDGFMTDQNGSYALTAVGRLALVGYHLNSAPSPPSALREHQHTEP